MLLLGIICLVAATAAGVLLVIYRPVSQADQTDPEMIQRYVQSFTPWQSWEAWESRKNGLDPRVNQKYLAAVTHFRVGLGVVAILAVAGIALLAAGLTGGKLPATTPRRQ